MDHLQKTLDKNQYVECIKVGSDDFYDFGKMEDRLYKQTPLTGHTKKYQLFYSDETEMGVIHAKHSDKSPTTHQMDLKKGNETQRKDILSKFDDDLEEFMERLTPPGIRTIKQVEMYTKWRKHVPDDHKSPLYDNPGEDVLQLVKEDRKSRKEHVASRQLLQEQADASGKLAARKTTEVEKQAAAKQKKPTMNTSSRKATPCKGIKER
jgi:hypothetical protein